MTSRPSRRVRDAIKRREGTVKPTPAQRRFVRQLEEQGFAVLAVGEGKVVGVSGREPVVVHRALVVRRGQPGVTVWAYSTGKWVAIVERFGEKTMLEGDSFEEVEEWYYRQVEGPRVKVHEPPVVDTQTWENVEAEAERRGFTYRDRRRVTA